MSNLISLKDMMCNLNELSDKIDDLIRNRELDDDQIQILMEGISSLQATYNNVITAHEEKEKSKPKSRSKKATRTKKPGKTTQNPKTKTMVSKCEFFDLS